MFSYPRMENSNRSLIQVPGSDWSEVNKENDRCSMHESNYLYKPLSFEAVGSTQDVTLPKMNNGEEVHLGITVQEGQGKASMLISFFREMRLLTLATILV